MMPHEKVYCVLCAKQVGAVNEAYKADLSRETDYQKKIRDLEDALWKMCEARKKSDSKCESLKQHIEIITNRIDSFDPNVNYKGKTMDQIEREVIEHTLVFFNGNRTKTALALNLSIRTIRNKIRKYRQDYSN